MKTAYAPMKVIRPGTVSFSDGVMILNGWTLDLAGRPHVADWQRVYAGDIIVAVAAYIGNRAKRHHEGETSVDPAIVAMAERETQRLIKSLSAASSCGAATPVVVRSGVNWPLVAWGAAWCAATAVFLIWATNR